MKIENNVFYLLESSEEKHIYSTEEEAIQKIQGIGEESSPDFKSTLLFEVNTEGEEWNMNQIPWSSIAEKLFGGE